jgi:hypothetical protein
MFRIGSTAIAEIQKITFVVSTTATLDAKYEEVTGLCCYSKGWWTKDPSADHKLHPYYRT